MKQKIDLSICYLYHSKDEEYYKELNSQLLVIKDISTWVKCKLKSGDEKDKEIAKKILEADIVIFLMSAEVLANNAYENEMKQIVEKHLRNEIKIISVLVRHCLYEESFAGKLQILPKNGLPIQLWEQRDNAYLEIVKAVKIIVANLKLIRVEKLLIQAKEQSKNKEYDNAILLLEKAQNIIPRQAEVIYQLGVNFKAKKDYVTAIRFFDRVLEGNAFSGNPLKDKAECNMLLKNFKKAANEYKLYIELNKDDTSVDIPYIKCSIYSGAFPAVRQRLKDFESKDIANFSVSNGDLLTIYESILEVCSFEEKRILYEVAAGKNPHLTYERLKQEGLIIEENGEHKLFSEHFAEYLRINERTYLYLDSFIIKNYYGIIETRIESIPQNTQWIFITGENGYGKSLVLKSLFIGLNGIKDNNKTLIHETDLSSFECNIKVHYKVEKNEQLEREEILELPQSKIPKKILVAYGASRLLIRMDEASQEADEKSSVSYSLFNNDGVLLNIENRLSFWSRKDKNMYEVVRRTLISLLPHIIDISVNQDTEKVEYLEEGNERILKYDELASGPRSILAMVGDMLIRLYKEQPDITEPKKLGGIVLIDELDLHLHPKWQKKFVEILTKTFPNVQFIASTHSFIPFLGAPANSVYIKVYRDKEKGIVAENLKLVVHPKEMLPNTLITSPLFDMDEFINPNSTDFRTETTYQEIVDNIESLKESDDDIELPDDF